MGTHLSLKQEESQLLVSYLTGMRLRSTSWLDPSWIACYAGTGFAGFSAEIGMYLRWSPLPNSIPDSFPSEQNCRMRFQFTVFAQDGVGGWRAMMGKREDETQSGSASKLIKSQSALPFLRGNWPDGSPGYIDCHPKEQFPIIFEQNLKKTYIIL